MDSIELLTLILVIILVMVAVLIVILGFLYYKSISDKRKKEEDANKKEDKVNSKKRKYKDYRLESIMNFLEFDTVVDNMISQKDGNRYVMVVECQGINYDLMSQVEKNGVEESFVQFLNTLRHPVQIYTQTRTINLEDSIHEYKKRIEESKNDLEKYELRYAEMKRTEKYTEEQLNKVYFELTKRRNLYEYGKDVVFNTERMSMNKNVLSKKYYVVIPYYIEELGENKFDKLEQRSYAFSELYTRAQSVIRTLSTCGINSRVLTSDELVDLLYMAYNRDEAEIYGIEKAKKAGYDELYTTAEDVVDKQMKLLDQEIEHAALDRAKQKIKEVKSDKQRELEEKRETKDDLIDELAKLILQENKEIVGDEIAEKAIEKIDNEKEGGTNEDTGKVETKKARKSK